MFKTSLFLSYQNKFGTNSATLKLSKTINRLFFFKEKKGLKDRGSIPSSTDFIGTWM